MGNRYFITGVQLGLLVGIEKQNKRQDVADEIIDNQHLCEAEELSRLKYKEAKKILNKLRSKN